MHFHQLKRCEFITLLGGAVAAWPLAGLRKRMKQVERRCLGLLAVVTVGIFAPLVYRALGVHFLVDPLDYYLQYLDPELLRHDLVRSLFYLREQPPGFNGFLGVVLKLFPVHYAAAFGVIYFLGGLAISVMLYALMLRFGVRVWLASLATILFVGSPITILYENWLFYTFPLAVMLCASALFLHRWLSARHLADAVVFFSLLAAIVLVSGLFHALWMLAVVAALLAIERAQRQKVALAALGPVLVVCALSVKHVVVFHTIFPGRWHQQHNLAKMTSMRLPNAERAQLLRDGKLTISNVGVYAGPNVFRGFVPPQQNSGIPALDNDYKSNGAPNWNSRILVPIGELYGADAGWTLRHRPGVYVDAVRENVRRYFLPSDQTWPFYDVNNTANQNRLLLEPILTLWNRLFSWQRAPYSIAVAHIIGFPLLLAFALVMVMCGFRRDRFLGDLPARSDELTVIFALYSTVWVTAVTVLLSYDDHNRYRFMCPRSTACFWRSLSSASLDSFGVRPTFAALYSEVVCCICSRPFLALLGREPMQ